MPVTHDGNNIPTLEQSIGPDAQLTFAMNWTKWLNGIAINQAVWTLPPDLTSLFEIVESGNIAKIQIAGFQEEVLYSIKCAVETVPLTSGHPEKDSRSFEVWCTKL